MYFKRSEEYEQHLKSPEWRALAEERLKIDNYKCRMCGTTGTMLNPLQVHHYDYKRLGHEDVWTDLGTFCKVCHKAIHRAMNRRTSENKYGWHNTLPFTDHVFEIGESITSIQGEVMR